MRHAFEGGAGPWFAMGALQRLHPESYEIRLLHATGMVLSELFAIGALEFHGGGERFPAEEPTSRIILVDNVTPDDELRAVFECFGNASMLYTGIAVYCDVQCAKRAMRALQNTVLWGRELEMQFIIPKCDFPVGNPGDVGEFVGVYEIREAPLEQLSGARAAALPVLSQSPAENAGVKLDAAAGADCVKVELDFQPGASDDKVDEPERDNYRLQLLLIHCLKKLCVPAGYLRHAYAPLLEKFVKMELIPDTVLGLSESELERAFEQAFAGEMMEASEPSEKAFWSKSRHSRFYEDFDEIEEIGRGAFGVVFKCRCKLDGQVYAVKCINIPSSAPKARIDKILREVELLAQVQHPHIVRYFAAWCEFTQDVQTPEKGSSKSNNVKVAGGFRSDPSGTNRCDPQQGRPVTPVKATSAGGDDRVPSLAFTPPSYPRDEETGRKLYIQMEYCPLDLSKCLKDEDTKKKLSAPKIFGQLVAGVECLHSCGILHRDLAPKNVFLDSDLNVKLGDLGSAKAGCWVSGYIGTPWYIAPEVNTRGNELSDKADVYALGVIAQELWQKLGRPAPPGVEPLLADIPARRPSSKDILTEERYRHLVEQVSD